MLGGAVEATGTSTTSSSGNLTTTNPADILVGANAVQTLTLGSDGALHPTTAHVAGGRHCGGSKRDLGRGLLSQPCPERKRPLGHALGGFHRAGHHQ